MINSNIGTLPSPQLYDFRNKRLAVHNYVIQMLNRTQRMFRYTNLPKSIPQLHLENMIQRNGHICFFEHEGTLYVFAGAYAGVPDPYYVPEDYIIVNPNLKLSKTLKVDVDCVVMRNDSNNQGLLPIHSRYATLLLENDITMRMTSINARIPTIVTAHTDTDVVTANVFRNKIVDGEDIFAVKDGFSESLRTQPYNPLDTNVTKQIEYHQYVKGAWFNELGLRASFNMKREAISASEASMNDDILIPLIDDMYEQRLIGIEKVNQMYGCDISVDFDSIWKRDRNIRDIEYNNIINLSKKTISESDNLQAESESFLAKSLKDISEKERIEEETKILKLNNDKSVNTDNEEDESVNTDNEEDEPVNMDDMEGDE